MAPSRACRVVSCRGAIQGETLQNQWERALEPPRLVIVVGFHLSRGLMRFLRTLRSRDVSANSTGCICALCATIVCSSSASRSSEGCL